MVFLLEQLLFAILDIELHLSLQVLSLLLALIIQLGLRHGQVAVGCCEGRIRIL